MKPGDVITCKDCGATATATWSSLEHQWMEGCPVSITWQHGPHLRHEIARQALEQCSWCRERAAGFRSVMGRPRPGETWTIRGPKLTYEIPAIGVEFTKSQTSKPAERSAGEGSRMTATEARTGEAELRRRASAVLGPAVERVQQEFLPPVVERFAEMAAAYRTETGREPPVQGAPIEAWQHWTAWLHRHRQAKAADSSQPKLRKGQLSLL